MFIYVHFDIISTVVKVELETRGDDLRWRSVVGVGEKRTIAACADDVFGARWKNFTKVARAKF